MKVKIILPDELFLGACLNNRKSRSIGEWNSHFYALR